MIVVDASVAFKWLKSQNEPDYQAARRILEKHLDGTEPITVPNHLFIEIANALATKTDTSINTIKKDLFYLYKANLQVRFPDQTDIIESSVLAKKHKTSIYDMIYATTAKKLGIIFVTADAKFIQKTKFKFVRLLA